MGLDMYMERVEFDGFDFLSDKKLHDVMYWRKAYVIMDWFCTNLSDHDNLDNCARYIVTIDDLKELYDFCKKYVEYNLNGLDEDINIRWYDNRRDDYELDYLKSTIRWLEDEFKYYDKHIEYTADIYYMFYGWW